MKLTKRVFKTVVTVAVILTILLNISCTKQNRLMEFEIGGYDFRDKMGQKIRENANGGRPSALRPSLESK